MKQGASQIASLFLLGWVVLFLWLAVPTTVAAQGAPQKSEAKKRLGQATERKLQMRDPFRPLVAFGGEDEDKPLPPGKRGLVIARLTVNGIVVAPGELIAVVTMRGRNRAYFLRERDKVYDGYVTQITEDGVVFKERATDAFGTPYEREVTKPISGSGAKR